VGGWSPKLRVAVVGVLLVLALVLRVAEVQRTAYQPINDAAAYLVLASSIAHTGDYPDSHAPGSGAGGSRGPTAYFPPAFPYFLAAVDLIGGHTGPRGAPVHPARLAQAVLGTATVALVGLVGLEAFGELVGLIALGLAAVYPVLIELSGTIVAENLMTLLVLAAVWAALRIRHAEHPYRWVAVAGVLTGLATLSHVNSILLVIPLGVAAWSLGRVDMELTRHRLAGVGLLVLATVLTLVPWTVRNAIELHQFVPVADETGITLIGTYNAASAANHAIPYRWRVFYTVPGEPTAIKHPTGLTEVELSARLQSQALHYISKHPAAPLAVLYHNSRRLIELEGSYAWKTSASSIDLPLATARIGVFSFWILCMVAIAGVFTRDVRRAPGWLWLVPVLLWLSVALVNAETPRFREPIDPFLILLASCALAAALRSLAPRLAAPARRQRRPAVAGGARELVEMRQCLS
jgi:4-amino-4-deoxy-L-arabinose transferase-like glycosyltransferase